MSTIKSAREIQAIFQGSRRVSHPLMVALITPTPEGRGPEGRVVFVAGRKIGSAVKRNRAKRVMREAYRRFAGDWAGYDVALVARPGVGEASPDQLDRALADIARRGGLTR